MKYKICYFIFYNVYILIMKVIFFILLFSLMGCNRSIKFDPDMDHLPNNQATVFFYLEHSKGLIEPSVSIPIIANDKEIGEISSGVFIKHYFKPGQYKIHSHTASIDRMTTFLFENGKIYFIKVWVDIGVWVSSVRFTQTNKPDKI